MTDKITRAARQLNCILPLVKHHNDLDDKDARVHYAILNSYASRGRAPTIDEIVDYSDDVHKTLVTLELLDMIVRDSNDNILGAYPFTSEQRIHRVRIGDNTVHCMCALDSLAVSPMFQQPTHIYSKCVVSGAQIYIHQDIDRVVNADENQGVYFAIDWGAADANACCADSLCGYMDFIKGDRLAREWQAKSDTYEIFNLSESIDFATRFFSPLMARQQAA